MPERIIFIVDLCAVYSRQSCFKRYVFTDSHDLGSGRCVEPRCTLLLRRPTWMHVLSFGVLTKVGTVGPLVTRTQVQLDDNVKEKRSFRVFGRACASPCYSHSCILPRLFDCTCIPKPKQKAHSKASRHVLCILCDYQSRFIHSHRVGQKRERV